MKNNGRTTCLVAGGGPAGMVLGLLLARAGVEVTVLEKHADFLRDFRGDTVHASTLTLLDELGLGEQFAALPQRRIDRLQVQLDAGFAQVVDLARLPGAHQHIALVPQWDFLDLVADAAAQEPTFTLLRNAEVVGLLRVGSRVVGVRYRDHTDPASRELGAGESGLGSEHEIRAALTVGCDGRGSMIRVAAGLTPRSFGVPMDVWWFRLPRRAQDPTGGLARITAGHFLVGIDRGDYWQCAYLIKKGSDRVIRAAGLPAFRDRVAGLLPWLSDRLGALTSFDDVKLLDVRLDRLRRWYADGVLLIGDAAHAMSPVGGVGINLAVQDAVATARILGPALRSGGDSVPVSLLRRVQLRRWLPTAVIQTGQRLAHRALLGPTLSATPSTRPGRTDPATTSATTPAAPGTFGGGAFAPIDPADLPLPLRLLQRFPALQGIPARLVAIGPLPEHAPRWARRAAAPR